MTRKGDPSEYAEKHRFIPTLPTIYEDSQYMKPSDDSDAALYAREEQMEPETWATGIHHMEIDEEQSESLMDELLLPHERADQRKTVSAPPPTKPRTIKNKTKDVLEKDPWEKVQGICGAIDSAYAP